MNPRDELIWKIDQIIYYINDTEDKIESLEIKLKTLYDTLLELRRLEDEQKVNT